MFLRNFPTHMNLCDIHCCQPMLCTDHLAQYQHSLNKYNYNYNTLVQVKAEANGVRKFSYLLKLYFIFYARMFLFFFLTVFLYCLP